MMLEYRIASLDWRTWTFHTETEKHEFDWENYGQSTLSDQINVTFQDESLSDRTSDQMTAGQGNLQWQTMSIPWWLYWKGAN